MYLFQDHKIYYNNFEICTRMGLGMSVQTDPSFYACSPR